MPDNLFNGSAPAGSPIATGGPNPNSFGDATGQPSSTPASQVDPAAHAELESLVGRQGQELGEFRKFFSDIAPLLDKLDKSPEIVQAIIDGNIDTNLAKAAMEGKVSIESAQIVSQAHEEVKKELGKDYKGATPEEINKLVSEKVGEVAESFAQELKERDELSAFESDVNDFISRTPDFAEYASEIDKWLDNHDVTDIQVAYYAVKGELSEKEAIRRAEVDRAELAKTGALDMGGGQNTVTHIRGDSGNIIDSLIASKSNPNNF